MQRYLSTLEDYGNVTSVTALPNNESHPTMPLLREWAKLTLTTAMWKDALTSASRVSIVSFEIAHIADANLVFSLCSRDL